MSTTTAVVAESGCASPHAHDPIVHVLSVEEIGQKVGERIIALSKQAIEERGVFSIAFSGGSLPGLVAKPLIEHQDEIDFTKWRVYLADERLVPDTHPDSNLKAVRDLLLSKLRAPPTQVFGIVDASVPAFHAAALYESYLPEAELMDLVLLGMGPDGHTASLFPGHELVEYRGVQRVVSISDSPKPPAERITFALDFINHHTRHVFFVTTGAGKQDAVARCAVPLAKLEPNPLPSARVRPVNSPIEWYVDADAAAKL